MAKRIILTNLLETSTRLGIPAKWLKDAAVSGVIPCLLIGKRQMLFDPRAVEEAMAQLAAGNYGIEEKRAKKVGKVTV